MPNVVRPFSYGLLNILTASVSHSIAQRSAYDVCRASSCDPNFCPAIKIVLSD